jgi:hypothetical protein
MTGIKYGHRDVLRKPAQHVSGRQPIPIRPRVLKDVEQR